MKCGNCGTEKRVPGHVMNGEFICYDCFNKYRETIMGIIGDDFDLMEIRPIELSKNSAYTWSRNFLKVPTKLGYLYRGVFIPKNPDDDTTINFRDVVDLYCYKGSINCFFISDLGDYHERDIDIDISLTKEAITGTYYNIHEVV